MSRSPPSNLPRDRRGMAAVEFALTAPVLLLILLGVADLATLIRAVWHMERAAGEVANVIAQMDALRESDFAVFYDVADRIAAPYALTGQAGAIMVTGLSGTPTGAVVSWRRRAGAGEILSRFGTGTTPVLPVGFALPNGQTAIAVETYVRVQPWVFATGLLGDGTQTLAGFGIFRPRLSSLSTIAP